jgi:hypothetical protein
MQGMGEAKFWGRPVRGGGQGPAAAAVGRGEAGGAEFADE